MAENVEENVWVNKTDIVWRKEKKLNKLWKKELEQIWFEHSFYSCRRLDSNAL